jgi:hypothetical protein
MSDAEHNRSSASNVYIPQMKHMISKLKDQKTQMSQIQHSFKQDLPRKIASSRGYNSQNRNSAQTGIQRITSYKRLQVQKENQSPRTNMAAFMHHCNHQKASNLNDS